MVVADGLGGEAKGELASRLAVSAGVKLGLRFGRWNLRIDDETAKEVMERAEYYYKRVHDVVAERASSDPTARGMGTTLTLAFTAGNELFLGHVGDSRAYLLRNCKLYRLTHDQTLAQLLADEGKILQKDVDTHHLRNVLTEAIGVGKDDPKIQVKRLQLDDGDSLLLCTDGLTEMVQEEQISRILIDHTDPQGACAELVKAALENGGRDNITVLLGKYSIPT
jgi:protein phosphatase